MCKLEKQRLQKRHSYDSQASCDSNSSSGSKRLVGRKELAPPFGLVFYSRRVQGSLGERESARLRCVKDEAGMAGEGV
jgi:hypothetical protein